jgi:hypothetical protein
MAINNSNISSLVSTTHRPMSVEEVTVEIIITVISATDEEMRSQDQEVVRDPHTIIIIIRENTSAIGMIRKRASIAAHLTAHIHQVVAQVKIEDAIEGGVGVEEMIMGLDADRHLRNIKKNVVMVVIIDTVALLIQENKT